MPSKQQVGGRVPPDALTCRFTCASTPARWHVPLRSPFRQLLTAAARWCTLTVSQYTSFAFTSRLTGAGIDASIGTVGDARNNALMESTIGLYKTELIKPRGPWRNLADVELATAEYIGWYNNRRLHTAIGGIPPAEHEAVYYAQNQPQLMAGCNNRSPTKPGGRYSSFRGSSGESPMLRSSARGP
jgi:transposase InsO family protein